MVAFVLDYACGIGGELVMCCFAHLAFSTITRTPTETQRAVSPKETRDSYIRYSVFVLIVLCALSACVVIGDMGDYAMGTAGQCWFIYDTHNYSLKWFEIPQGLTIVVTIAYLYRGYRHIRSLSGQHLASKSTMWNYAALSFPVPILRMVPTVANACFSLLVVFGLDTEKHSGLYSSMGLLACTTPLCTLVAYAIPRWIIAHASPPTKAPYPV
ncbi:hypothetical protein KIPB_011084 [Kipferlia bialata]|uniref:Uncharacterized protein n=1 Tax=Kipferlia bialata TaxID=797122 RepID=A0A9K3D7I2_9EUKA|nr:hypothetical protein KIPB_011084 [Kipferlia bialata]|eukprot:g11084.t1